MSHACCAHVLEGASPLAGLAATPNERTIPDCNLHSCRCAGDGSGQFRWWYGLLASLAAAALLAALLAGMMVWWRRRRRLRDVEATKLAVVERVRGSRLPFAANG